MIPGFHPLPFLVKTVDGRNFVLAGDFYYYAKDGHEYLLPVGATSDGASTPQTIWNLIPPFGKYWPAAFLHDCAYRNTLMIFNGTTWVPAALPKEKCDALLREAMQALGCNELEVETIYESVVLGGTSSFDKDRASGSEAFMA